MTLPDRLVSIPAISRDDLVITGPDLTQRVGKWATTVPLEMDHTSTAAITVSLVEQENGELLKAMAGFFQRDPKTGIRRLKRWNVLRLHDTNYILAVMRRTSVGLDLDFYDEASEDLGRYFGPLKWARNRFTRAQGIKGLANEAGVLSYIPDQNTKLPIADLAREDRRELRESRQENSQAKAVARRQAKDAGLAALRKAARNGEITVQGAKPGAIETQAMADALSVADELEVEARVRLIMVIAGIGESGFDPRETDYATGTHKGVFQSNVVPQFDTKQQARYFLKGGRSFHIGGAIGLAKRFPDASPGEIVRQVEISDGSAAYYDKWRKEAEAIIAAWLPGGGDSGSRVGSTDRAHVERFEFSIGARESYWDAIDRFASDVRWRRFAAFNHLVYASDFTLADINPYELDLDDNWIDDPGQWVCSRDEAIDELPLTGRLAAIVPPGTAFAVTDDNPLYGTWLARHFRRDLLDEDCNVTLTLTRPQAPLPEPASTVKRRVGRDPSDEGVSDASGLRAKIVEEAEKTLTSRTGYRYYLAGGNQSRLTDPLPPTTGGYRSDCSQWIYAIYLKAGAKNPGVTTYDMVNRSRRTKNPKPGDLVLMDGHVELYVGNGRTIGHGDQEINYGTASWYIANRGAWYATYDFLND